MKKKIALALAAIMTFAAAVPMTLMAAGSTNIAVGQFYGYDENTLVPQASLNLNNKAVSTTLPDIADTTATGIGGALRIEFQSSDDANQMRGFTVQLKNAEWAFIDSPSLTIGGSAHSTYDKSGNVVVLPSVPGADTRILYLGAAANMTAFVGTIGTIYEPVTGSTPLTGQAAIDAWISGNYSTAATSTADGVSHNFTKTELDAIAFPSSSPMPFLIEIDNSRLERANVNYFTGPGIVKGDRFEIPLVVKTKNKEVVTATIASGGTSYVTDQEVQLSASGKGTKASISGVEEGTKYVDLKPLYIDENSIGSLKGKGPAYDYNGGDPTYPEAWFKVVAPKGYEWASLSASGTKLDLLNLGTPSADAYWELRKNDTEIWVALPGTVASTNISGAVRLSGLRLVPIDTVLKIGATLAISISDDKDSTGVTSQTLDVAKFVTNAILYSAKDAKGIYAGYRDQEAAKVTVEEQTSISMWAERETILSLTDEDGDLLDGVKFTNVEIDPSNFVSFSKDDYDNIEYYKGTKSAGFAADDVCYNDDGNQITIGTQNVVKDKKGKLVITPKLSADINFEGDVYLKFSNKGITYDDDGYIENGGIVKIATVEPTVAIETTSTSVQIGSQRISVSDVIISELVEDKMFERTKNIDLLVGQYGNGTAANIDIVPLKDANVIVTGDMKIKIDFTKGSAAKLIVDRVSIDDLSTIKLAGVQVNVDRSVPYGVYELYVSGNALRNNSPAEFLADKLIGNWDSRVSTDFRDYFDNEGIVVDNYITVDTQSINPAFATKVVVYNDGSANVVVNGVAQEMGAATENINGSLYVPLRFIAYALGAQEQDIVWSDLTRTVSVNLNGRQVTWTEGSAIYVSYGVSQAMNNGAVSCIINDRLYIPFRGFAEAFNIPVVWDEATQTATYNPAVNK